MATTCLQTRIRNTSGKTLTVNFLRRGKRLANEDEISIDGDVWDKIKKKREMDSFKTLLDAGDLTIMSSPAELHYDDTLAMPKVIDVDNGATVVADPCYGAWSSSIGG